MTEQNRDATEFEEAEGNALAAEVERLTAALTRWMDDPRAGNAVAGDCNGNEDGNCPCLYCDSVRALCGK